MNNWNENYKVGNQEIDSHHKELFHLDALLDKAISSGNPENINSIIKFLEHYVEEHFEEEETLMLESDYTGYSIHKAEHEAFKKNVTQLRYRFDSKFPPTHIIFQIRKLVDNLVQHIKHIDIGIKHLENKK